MIHIHFLVKVHLKMSNGAQKLLRLPISVVPILCTFFFLSNGEKIFFKQYSSTPSYGAIFFPVPVAHLSKKEHMFHDSNVYLQKLPNKLGDHGNTLELCWVTRIL